jgi:hypothetical protein
LKPARRRELARWIREQFGTSGQQACRLELLRRSTWYRRSRAKDQTPLRMRIRELALNRPRFGYLRIHILLRREGWLINRKRVHRLYLVSARRTAGTHAGAPTQALELASRSCPVADSRQSALEHGLCPRSAAQRPAVSG